ncbi:MAG: tRNA modification GTPase TrmE [Methanomassiliicoccales archaeon PtaU1.Bin124]|nr:MAG: tRNA modification GTPase TrmE [Methanomassiliicoccales archaeon PtaU1.Bin124]
MLNFRKQIPTIMTSQEILDKAFKRAVKIDSEGESKFDMIKKKSVARITATGDIISTLLVKYNRSFPSVNKREGFMVELMCVMVDMDELKQSLSKLEWAAEKVGQLRKGYIAKVKASRNLNELDDARKEYYGRMSSIVHRLDKDLAVLAAARERYRTIPMVDEDIPTIVIAGFPNVGKSQLVELISTAKPEIAPYPFTTQGIGVGHFTAGWRKFQVIDTPGLLDRPLEDRNQIELQAILALKYLADIIVFILDPSETAGYTMEQQENLLRSVRTNFEGIPIIEVENKVDILRSDSDRMKISAKNGIGTDALVEELIKYLRQLEKEQNVMLPKE